MIVRDAARSDRKWVEFSSQWEISSRTEHRVSFVVWGDLQFITLVLVVVVRFIDTSSDEREVGKEGHAELLEISVVNHHIVPDRVRWPLIYVHKD